MRPGNRVVGILVFFAIMTSSCGNSSWKPGVVGRWERVLGRKQSSAERKTAGQSPVKCLKDRTDLTSVKEEVARLESKVAGTPKKGSWNGVDLSRMNTSQANYLTSFDQWIQKDKMDFSRCSDLPCLLNQIYGGASQEPGWKIYLWYLKTGYGMGTMSFYPSWSPDDKGALRKTRGFFSEAILSDYLFDLRELDVFLQIAATLPSFYVSMPSLQSLHRIPRKLKPADWGTACGDYVGNITFGDIRLQDNCLTFTGKTAFDHYIYSAISHEMSHAFDAKTGIPGKWYSTFDDWTKLSGWQIEVPVDAQSKSASIAWIKNPTKEKFVTDYAGTSPMEDFAETMSHFRYQAELTRSKVPQKFEFVAQKFYGGRNYSKQGIQDYYFKNVTDAVNPLILETVEGCTSGLKNGDAGDSSATQVNQCLESKINQSISDAMDRLRETEYEACEVFSGSLETQFRASVLSTLNPVIERTIAQQGVLGPLLKASVDLRRALSLNIDSREVFLHCYQAKDQNGCFDKAVSAAFDSTSAPYASALGDSLAQEKENFMAKNNFAVAQESFTGFYRPILAEASPYVTAGAESRWEDCTRPEIVNSKNPSLMTAPFSGGAQFVSKQVLTCLNANAFSDIKDAQSKFIANLGSAGFNVNGAVSDPDLAAYFRDVLLPVYLASLKGLLSTQAAVEEQERAGRKTGFVEILVSQLGKGARPAAAKCEAQAQKEFTVYFSKMQPQDRLPTKFEAIENIRREWAREACQRFFGKT